MRLGLNLLVNEFNLMPEEGLQKLITDIRKISSRHEFENISGLMKQYIYEMLVTDECLEVKVIAYIL